jgi:DNA-binding FadR family transcriptional regulator
MIAPPRRRTGAGLKVVPLRTARVYEEIAEQIRHAVYSRRLLPGDRLPSERDLAERFHTSRVSVREALRSLQHIGLLVIRRGAGGGAFIADAPSAPITTSLSTMLAAGTVSVNDLTEARVLLEPDIARMAAKRGTKQDIDAIEAVISEQEQALAAHSPHHYDLRFHRLVAQASKNPVLALVMNSVADLIVQVVSSLQITYDQHRHVNEFHEEVLRAIKKKDGDRAYDLMFRHVLDTQRRTAEALRRLR